MKYFILFAFVFLFYSYGGAIDDCGALPTWKDLHMNRKGYFMLSGFSGLLSGILFTFLITK